MQRLKWAGGCCLCPGSNKHHALKGHLTWRLTYWMLQGCKVTKTSPALLAHIQPHTSKSCCSDGARWETTIISRAPFLKSFTKFKGKELRAFFFFFWACDPEFGATEHTGVFITGDRIVGGSRLTGGLYQEAQSIQSRQNIKVLQQLLLAQRLKSEPRQNHGELVLRCQWSILPWMSSANHTCSLWSQEILNIFYVFAPSVVWAPKGQITY